MIGWAAELVGLTRTLSALIPMLFAVALLSRLPVRRVVADVERPGVQR